jgi:hypothetical protein
VGFLAALRIAASMTFADSSLVKGFLSAANMDWPITTAHINRSCFMPLRLTIGPCQGKGAFIKAPQPSNWGLFFGGQTRICRY